MSTLDQVLAISAPLTPFFPFNRAAWRQNAHTLIHPLACFSVEERTFPTPHWAVFDAHQLVVQCPRRSCVLDDLESHLSPRVWARLHTAIQPLVEWCGEQGFRGSLTWARALNEVIAPGQCPRRLPNAFKPLKTALLPSTFSSHALRADHDVRLSLPTSYHEILAWKKSP